MNGQARLAVCRHSVQAACVLNLSSPNPSGLQVTDALSSMASFDEEPQNLDPNDPMKFFQPEDKNSDYIQAATLVALLYFAYTAWTEIEKLK